MTFSKRLVPESEEGFRLSPEEQALLLESIGQAERDEVVDGWQLLADLQAIISHAAERPGLR
jgi:hypothetical protein